VGLRRFCPQFILATIHVGQPVSDIIGFDIVFLLGWLFRKRKKENRMNRYDIIIFNFFLNCLCALISI